MKARNDYLLALYETNAAINRYFVDDVSQLLDVRTPTLKHTVLVKQWMELYYCREQGACIVFRSDVVCVTCAVSGHRLPPDDGQSSTPAPVCWRTCSGSEAVRT
jgi:hypothetical protein